MCVYVCVCVCVCVCMCVCVCVFICIYVYYTVREWVYSTRAFESCIYLSIWRERARDKEREHILPLSSIGKMFFLSIYRER